MKFTGEFFIPPGNDDGKFNNRELLIEHKHRYLSILELAKDKIVLDIACGEGYGSNLLSDKASQVYAVDINAELIAHASNTYLKKNISFIEASVENIPLPGHSVDMIVSFETLEHINAELQVKFLAEAKRVLKPGGLLAISTPDKKNYTDRYKQFNEFHVHELYTEEFVALLQKKFAHVNLFNQGFEVTSLVLNRDSYVSGTTLNSLKVEENAYNFEGKYLIGLCSDDYEKAFSSISSIIPESERSYFSLNDRIIELQLEVEKLGSWGKRSNQEIETLRKRIEELQQHTEELGAWGRRSNAEVEATRVNYNTLQKQFDVLSLKEQSQEILLQQKSEELKKLGGQLIELNELKNLPLTTSVSLEKNIQKTIKANYGLKRDLERKSKQINKLEAANQEMAARLHLIYTSDGYKLLSKYYKLKQKLLPEGSKAYSLLRSFVRTLKNKKTVKQPENSPTIVAAEPENKLEYIPKVPDNIQFPLAFPVFEQPLVSIIIPIYNNWVLTRNCLISIYQHTTDIAYEIIVADDVSTDEVVNIKKYFKNINHQRNKENLGYIKNVNNAARQVRGKFILTLNNDTTVTPNWLNHLLAVMEKDELTGLVGSKLVYPDGSLQEAGGIIWKDGSGWNYGNRRNADAAEFNYLKEADYLSGASLLVRKELWDQLKGLDERFVPAYFDDSDLAFSIRQLGYKTIYQPLSVVVHYEGLSHGTSTSSGIKKYQAINAQKFVEKWKTVLNEEHFNNGEEVFVARDRSRYKKTVVVIDHYVPHFDKDAGSRTTFNILQVLTKLNYNVKFLGDNFYNHEPYTTVLQQMGVEVLYGEWYMEHWQDWIIDNGEHIDFFYLNRPHITIKYIDFIREVTKAKVFFYGHDLHFLREQKQYELEKTPELLQSIEYWKKLETELFEKSDVVLTCSAEEQEIIAKQTSNKNVYVIPAYCYSQFNQPVTNFSERENLLFVGGFDHRPNVDAVLWFTREVMPLITQKNPTLKFIIAGSNPPPEVIALKSVNVEVLGFLPYEELDNLYKKTKLVIIPLRYGAGVKGKTVEAMYHGVPFVTTQFGIEGMVGIKNIVTSRNTAEGFANGIFELYYDNNALIDFSKKIIEYVSQNFSEANMKNIITTVFS